MEGSFFTDAPREGGASKLCDWPIYIDWPITVNCHTHHPRYKIPSALTRLCTVNWSSKQEQVFFGKKDNVAKFIYLFSKQKFSGKSRTLLMNFYESRCSRDVLPPPTTMAENRNNHYKTCKRM